MHCERVLKLKRGESWIKKFRRCPYEAIGRFKIPGKEGFLYLCQRCVDKKGAIPVSAETIQPIKNARARTKGKKTRK